MRVHRLQRLMDLNSCFLLSERLKPDRNDSEQIGPGQTVHLTAVEKLLRVCIMQYDYFNR